MMLLDWVLLTLFVAGLCMIVKPPNSMHRLMIRVELWMEARKK